MRLLWQWITFFLVALMFLPAHAKLIRGFDFPRSLAGCELHSVIDNEKSNPGLGVTLLYNAPLVKVSVFVYDGSRRNIPEGIDSPVIRDEFAGARSNVQRMYPDTQIWVRESRFAVADIPILHSAFQHTEMKPGSRETVVSHLYLTARNGNFIKVRATYSLNERPELGYRIQTQFIEQLCYILAK